MNSAYIRGAEHAARTYGVEKVADAIRLSDVTHALKNSGRSALIGAGAGALLGGAGNALYHKDDEGATLGHALKGALGGAAVGGLAGAAGSTLSQVLPIRKYRPYDVNPERFDYFRTRTHHHDYQSRFGPDFQTPEGVRARTHVGANPLNDIGDLRDASRSTAAHNNTNVRKGRHGNAHFVDFVMDANHRDAQGRAIPFMGRIHGTEEEVERLASRISTDPERVRDTIHQHVTYREHDKNNPYEVNLAGLRAALGLK
jgi:hypothetical protein